MDSTAKDLLEQYVPVRMFGSSDLTTPVCRLITRPRDRVKSGALRHHPFFKEITWDDIREGELYSGYEILLQADNIA